MSMTGNVIVTTPHPLAIVDVLKGHEMMKSMHVPTLALVSHSLCPHSSQNSSFICDFFLLLPGLR